MFNYIYIAFLLLISPAASNQVDEVTLKAIYVERFTRFIEWPSGLNNEEFFRIQVVGDPLLAQQFRDIFQRLQIKNRDILVYADDVYNLGFSPHLIYITNQRLIKDIAFCIAEKPVLIITEGRGGAEAGGMINIYRKNQKLKFEINEKAFYDSPLYVSYRLMKSAENIVNPLRSHK